MNSFIEKIQEALGRLTARQKFQLGLALVATLGLVWGFTVYVNQVRYGVLFSNLERDDAAPVMAALKERQVPYRIAAGGSIIEVPFERIDELRLELAGDGLPPGGGVGFELFDKPAFGLSDFVQNVNYQRALEREVARTIQSLDAVESARVHLALPAESVFADEKRHPSASVVLRMRSGRALAADRVRAITHMVASGVEGLDPANVSVIDGDGRMLSSGGDDQQALSAPQLEAKQSLEQGIRSTLISILEPLVGPGRVRARATVELNMTRVERVEESYDPGGAVVRSEQKSKTRNENGGGGGGIPGTASNLPAATAGSTAAGSGGRQETQSTLTNFEINKTVSTISEPVGMLAHQSVAVVVDHALVETTNEAGETERVPTPRSPGEMQKITDLVRAAIGIDEQRGDQLIVENVPFDENALPAEDQGAGGGGVTDLVLKIMRYGSLPLAVLLVALLVIRPAISAIRGLHPAPPEGSDDSPPTVAQLQARVQAQLSQGELPAALAGAASPLRAKLIEAVSEDPQAAALVIRNWIERPKERV